MKASQKAASALSGGARRSRSLDGSARAPHMAGVEKRPGKALYIVYRIFNERVSRKLRGFSSVSGTATPASTSKPGATPGADAGAGSLARAAAGRVVDLVGGAARVGVRHVAAGVAAAG